MTTVQYGIDRYLTPITIDSTNKTLVLDFTTSGSTTLTLTEGTYWGHREAFLGTSPNYPGLYEEIESQLTSAGFTGTFAAATPPGSDITDGGLSLTVDEAFQYNFGSSTIDPRLFGFSASAGTYPSSAQTTVVGKYSRWACWQSYTRWNHRGAHQKWRDEIRGSASSQPERPLETYEYETTRRRTRMIRYSQVPALHVWQDADVRGAEPNYIDSAGLVAGDNHNALEDLWESGKDLDEIILMHDDTDTLKPTDGFYEVVKLGSKEQRDSFQAIVGDRPDRPNGEFIGFTLELEVDRDEGTYTY